MAAGRRFVSKPLILPLILAALVGGFLPAAAAALADPSPRSSRRGSLADGPPALPDAATEAILRREEGGRPGIPEADDTFFGDAIAMDGDTILVGAWRELDPTASEGTAYAYAHDGTKWKPRWKFLAPDAEPGDWFGYSVDVDGDTAIIGAPYDTTAAGFRAGSAYVFVRSGSRWVFQAQFTAPDGNSYEVFGISVALDGDTAVVGSDHVSGFTTGAAYVFARAGSTWTLQAELMPTDTGFGAYFGYSVAIDGGTLVAGAFGDDTAATDAGSAYVYVRSGTTWTQQAKLTAPDAAEGDSFGLSAALDGDIAVFGAYNYTIDQVANHGAAYVYVRSGTTWSLQAKIESGETSDYFGFSVALDGDTALIAAEGECCYGTTQGSVYVFVRSGTTWTQQATILPPDFGQYEGFFGTAVAIQGDTAAIGAAWDTNASGRFAGSVYVFVRSGETWGLEDHFNAPDAAADDGFGLTVAVDGDTAVVGAPGTDIENATNVGAAYVFVRAGTTWSLQAELLGPATGAYHSFGISVDIDGDTVVVGSPAAGWLGLGGEAYVFVRSGTTWTQQAVLTGSDTSLGDEFGEAVAIDGDTLMVGAPWSRNTQELAGSAYVFVRSGTTWTEQSKLVAPDPIFSAHLGTDVAVDGDTAVAATGVAVYDTDANSAYVWARSGTTWSLQAELIAPIDVDGEYFGTSVSVDADTVLVGAPGHDLANGLVPGAGEAYVYVRSGSAWSLQAELQAPFPAPFDSVGRSVALSGNTAVVGATGDDSAGRNAGSAWVFVRTGTSWTARAELTAPDGAYLDRFGQSLDLDGYTSVVGAYLDDTAHGLNSGSAHAFVGFGANWVHAAKLNPVP